VYGRCAGSQRMSGPTPYTIAFTPAARRRLDKLPLAAATALYEHLTAQSPRIPTGWASR